MAIEFEFSFTERQIEVLVKALEECGINSGSYRSALERFHDPELVNAAKDAHGILRRRSQKQARPTANTLAKELHNESAAANLRETLHRERAAHVDVMAHIDELLAAVCALRKVLVSKLDVQTAEDERAAREQLDDTLERIRETESELAQKLWDIENAS